MHALHAYARSDPSQLVFEDAPIPTLRPGDVLVHVHASGVSPGELDWGGTWLHHDGTSRTPPIIPGHEVSGVVEAVGADAAGIAVGDEVFGYIEAGVTARTQSTWRFGADELAPKPATLTHAQAACGAVVGADGMAGPVRAGRSRRGQRSPRPWRGWWRGLVRCPARALARRPRRGNGLGARHQPGSRPWRRGGDRLSDGALRGRSRRHGSRLRHGRRGDMGAIVGRARSTRPARLGRRAPPTGPSERGWPTSHLVHRQTGSAAARRDRRPDGCRPGTTDRVGGTSARPSTGSIWANGSPDRAGQGRVACARGL